LDLGLKRPSLDDVFLSLTGHAAEETDESEQALGSGVKK
ncbi:MAG: daunorubicin/doxorubicin resistance ABC transporter ATP-binding protein DrrA, partial [Candidatus Nanopelagicaceae bacterium]